MLRIGAPVVLALAVAAAGCTTAHHVDEATMDRSNREAVEKLSAQGTADSLVTAALVSYWRVMPHETQPSAASPEQADPAALAERALAAAPGDAAIAWIRLMMCESAPGCDARAAGAAFRQLDPDNAAGWIVDLRDAKQEGRDDNVDDILTRMASDSRFYVYHNALVVRVTETLIAARIMTWDSSVRPKLAQTLIDAISLVSVLPIFQRLSKGTCTDPARRAARQSNCLAITQIMLKGDAMVVQGVGGGIRRRLARPGTPECAEVL